MPSSDSMEPEDSRLGNLAMAAATVLAVIVAAEFGLRLTNKDYLNPANGGLIQRGHVAGTPTPEADAPFATNQMGLVTARPGADGINSDGFRAPEFSTFAKKKDLVLLIGDEQVFGTGADPISNALGDILAAGGTDVVNLGIPGAGVRQYAALAERYVSMLHPSTVVVLFNTADDFDIDAPPQPGANHCYYVNGHAIPATDNAGQPLTPDEAIKRANAAASPPGLLPRLLRKTALGGMLLNSLGFSSDAQRVPDVVDALDAVRQIAEDDTAVFQLILAPLPGDKGDEALERASAVLEKFSPASPGAYPASDFADPEFAVLNNDGHAKLAAFVESRLAALSGLSPVAAPLASSGKPLTLDEFCEATGLTGDDRQKAIDFINTLKEDVARIVFEPALDAPSAGEFAVGFAIANPGGKDFGAALMDYTSRHIHAATGLYYIDLMSESISERCTDFSESLPESIRPNFTQLQRRDLGSIDSGSDPLSQHITAAFEELKKSRAELEKSGSGGDMSWEDFVSALQLTPEQTEPIRALLNTLKQDFTDILSRPGKDGAPSPLMQVAAKLRENAPNDEIAQLMDKAMTGIEADSGKTYMELYMARESNLLGQIFALLTPEQVGLYPRLKVSALLKIKTGADPFNEAIAQAAAGGSGMVDPNDPNSWAKFRADLKLDDDQAAKILKIIDGLKDQIIEFLGRAPAEGKSPLETMRETKPDGIDKALAAMLARANTAIDSASGKSISKLMEEAEIEAHKAVYLLLTPQQVPSFEKIAERSLASIRTGHEPLDKAITAP